MLQTEGSKWAAGMGGESSKPRAPEGRSPPKQQTSLANSSPLPRHENSKDQSNNTHLGSGHPNNVVPLKRSREERDRDEARTQPRMRDHSMRAPMSPPNLRQSFIPDRGDHWTPNFRTRLDNGSLSPDSRRRSERGDRWAPSERRSSPPRRPSPVRRTSSEYNEWPRPIAKSSPVKPPPLQRDRHDSNSGEASPGSSFKNLTWKAPELESRPSVNVAKLKSRTAHVNGTSTTLDAPVAPRNADNTHSKVDFNGLKGVPTGPKQVPVGPSSDRSKLPNRILPPVDIAIKRSPHIFISTECVPAMVQTVKHLHRFLRKYIPRESDVCVDESGWYLCFEDSINGRERLQACYGHHNRAIFFSMYTLHMKPFPDGEPMPMPKSPTGVNGDSSSDSMKIGGRPPPTKATVDAQTFLDNLDVSFPANETAEHGANSAPGLQVITNDLNVNGTTSSPLPPELMIHYWQRSSPLGMPSRQDKDETSSTISGITNSDMSATKRLKCHVCQASTNSDADVLVHCSSCPRRYHRRCHLQPPIPPNMGLNHSWQCRRCVKKRVQPKSRLSNSSPAAASSPAAYSPAASVGQPEGPPPKKLRLDLPHQSPPLGPSVLARDLNILSHNDTIDAARHHGTDHNEMISDAEDSYEPADLPLVNSDERNLFEANDLVAKSFASIEAQPERQEKSKPKSEKLNLTRKKVLRTEEVRSPKQSGKPHKWSGGGADKDIIEAGKTIFFQGHHSPEQDIAADTADTPKAQSAIDAVATVEVRESPAEISGLGVDGNDLAMSIFSTERRVDHTVKSLTKDSEYVSKTGVQANSPIRNQATATQRMKPGMPTIAQCMKCQKRIAHHPSGTNKFCSRCKQEASVELEPTSQSTNSIAEKAENRTHRYSSTEEAKSTDLVAWTTPAVQEEAIPATEINTLEHYDSTRTTQTKPRTSCDKCRKNRRRCTHSLVGALRESGLALPSVSPKTVDEQTGDEGSDGDLNFWKTKPSPKSMKDVRNHISLSRNSALKDSVEASANSEVSTNNEEDSRGHSPTDTPDKSEAVSPQAKRQSQTRPPTGAHDLGDSFTRPPNTYVKLIGMALCSAPNHRLKGNDIVHWVIKNIPTYKAGAGKWENSLRATMTLKREGYGGAEGLWKIVDDGSKKNEGFTYELLPGKAETMLHWDPVLGMPVSPPKGWRIERKERIDDIERAVIRTGASTEDLLESPSKSLGTRRKQPTEGVKKQRSMFSGQNRKKPWSAQVSLSIETAELQSMEDIDDSSDEEPLARTRRKSSGIQAAIVSGSRDDSVEQHMAHVTDTDPNPDASRLSKPQLSKSPINASLAAVKVIPLPKRAKPTLEELIAMDSKNVDYSAKSLFDEWPEYDPKNAFDREAKIAEIEKRPTRKQRFGKQDSSVEMETSGPVSRLVFSEYFLSPERSKRMNRIPAYPWEVGEENLTQCDTVEELFGLPANPIAIIHDGDIAYRDGSKNYSRVIYKSGYA